MKIFYESESVNLNIYSLYTFWFDDLFKTMPRLEKKSS